MEAEEIVVFSEGDSIQCTCFAIEDDDVLENEETFEIVLDADVGPCLAVAVSPYVATVTIEDDDSEQITNNASILFLRHQEIIV